MATYRNQIFDKSRLVFVRRNFKAGGKLYLPGMLYDWRHQATSQRRMQQMFNSGYLCHDENLEAAEEQAEVKEVVENKENTETTENAESDPKKKKDKTPELDIAEISESEYNVVDSDGKVLNVAVLETYEDAERFLKELLHERLVGDSQ